MAARVDEPVRDFARLGRQRRPAIVVALELCGDAREKHDGEAIVVGDGRELSGLQTEPQQLVVISQIHGHCAGLEQHFQARGHVVTQLDALHQTRHGIRERATEAVNHAAEGEQIGAAGPVGGRQRLVDQAARPLDLSGYEGRPGGVDQTPHACRLGLAQLRRPLVGGGGRRVSAAYAKPLGGRLELGGDPLVGGQCGDRLVPDPAVGLHLGRARRGQRGVRAPTVVERGGFVNCRPNKRVAEGQPLPGDDDQASLLRRVQHISGQPQLSGRLKQHLELAAAVCRGEQQRRARVLGHALHPPLERRLQARGHGIASGSPA